jgi:hypothetical protein
MDHQVQVLEGWTLKEEISSIDLEISRKLELKEFKESEMEGA